VRRPSPRRDNDAGTVMLAITIALLGLVALALITYIAIRAWS
jgi:hypothetical protein